MWCIRHVSRLKLKTMKWNGLQWPKFRGLSIFMKIVQFVQNLKGRQHGYLKCLILFLKKAN